MTQVSATRPMPVPIDSNGHATTEGALPSPGACERVVRFECHGATLFGVLSAPGDLGAVSDTAVLIVVGGPQYRAGSHRQFVSLARALAQGGYPTLRFDYRGMGDSGGAQRGFEQASDDIAAAIDALRRECGDACRIVLWGLCDGASAALLYLRESTDQRISGMALVNPWVRSETTLARTHVKHYYLQRLRQREFWVKLFAGEVALRALVELSRNLGKTLAKERSTPQRNQPFQVRMSAAMAAFAGPVAVMLSGSDYTAKEFIEHANTDLSWRSSMARLSVTRVDFEAADHTFSGREAQRDLEAATLGWLDRFAAHAGR